MRRGLFHRFLILTASAIIMTLAPVSWAFAADGNNDFSQYVQRYVASVAEDVPVTIVEDHIRALAPGVDPPSLARSLKGAVSAESIASFSIGVFGENIKNAAEQGFAQLRKRLDEADRALENYVDDLRWERAFAGAGSRAWTEYYVANDELRRFRRSRREWEESIQLRIAGIGLAKNIVLGVLALPSGSLALTVKTIAEGAWEFVLDLQELREIDERLPVWLMDLPGPEELYRSFIQEMGRGGNLWGALLAQGAVPQPEALLNMLRTTDDPDAQTAIVSLLAYHGSDAVPLLVAAIQNDEWRDYRAPIAFALGQIGPRARGAVRHLIDLLEDGDPRVRYAAAEALQGIGAAASLAAGPLDKRLQNEEYPFTYRAAIKALEGIGPGARAALPTLGAIFADPNTDKEVKQLAQRALNAIQPGLTSENIDRYAILTRRSSQDSSPTTRGETPLISEWGQVWLQYTTSSVNLEAYRPSLKDWRAQQQHETSSGTVWVSVVPKVHLCLPSGLRCYSYFVYFDREGRSFQVQADGTLFKSDFSLMPFWNPQRTEFEYLFPRTWSMYAFQRPIHFTVETSERSSTYAGEFHSNLIYPYQGQTLRLADGLSGTLELYDTDVLISEHYFDRYTFGREHGWLDSYERCQKIGATPKPAAATWDDQVARLERQGWAHTDDHGVLWIHGLVQSNYMGWSGRGGQCEFGQLVSYATVIWELSRSRTNVTELSIYNEGPWTIDMSQWIVRYGDIVGELPAGTILRNYDMLTLYFGEWVPPEWEENELFFAFTPVSLPSFEVPISIFDAKLGHVASFYDPMYLK